jgi:hypothetical protein
MITPMTSYPKALQYEPFKRTKRIASILKTMDEYTHEELLLHAKDLRRMMLDSLSDNELEKVYTRECDWEIFQKYLEKVVNE